METTDQKTIVKRIAEIYKSAKKLNDGAINSMFNFQMLAYQTSLNRCGLSREEIIALKDADNLDEAIDDLFVKNSKNGTS